MKRGKERRNGRAIQRHTWKEEQRVREEREDGGRKALKLYFLKHEADDLGSIAFYCKGSFAEERRKCFTIGWHCRLS